MSKRNKKGADLFDPITGERIQEAVNPNATRGTRGRKLATSGGRDQRLDQVTQAFGRGLRTRRDISGNPINPDVPSHGLDWLEANGPDRPSVIANKQRMQDAFDTRNTNAQAAVDRVKQRQATQAMQGQNQQRQDWQSAFDPGNTDAAAMARSKAWLGGQGGTAQPSGANQSPARPATTPSFSSPEEYQSQNRNEQSVLGQQMFDNTDPAMERQLQNQMTQLKMQEMLSRLKSFGQNTISDIGAVFTGQQNPLEGSVSGVDNLTDLIFGPEQSGRPMTSVPPAPDFMFPSDYSLPQPNQDVVGYPQPSTPYTPSPFDDVLNQHLNSQGMNPMSPGQFQSLDSGQLTPEQIQLLLQQLQMQQQLQQQQGLFNGMTPPNPITSARG